SNCIGYIRTIKTFIAARAAIEVFSSTESTQSAHTRRAWIAVCPDGYTLLFGILMSLLLPRQYETLPFNYEPRYI
ncbi:MAG: hypothetical protein ACOYBL_02320, partial [Lachnospiraceae bacterium]